VTTSASPQSLSPPGSIPLAGHFLAYGRDPLGFVVRTVQEFGGVVPIRFGPVPALLIAEPAAIEEVLVERHRDFRKSRAARRVGVVVGDGILLSEGEVWRGHRRLVQPAFHHQRLASYGDVMVGETERMLAGWSGGETRDIHAEMVALTLAIVARSILDSQLEASDVAEVEQAAGDLTDHFESRFNSLRFFVPDLLPTPGNLRMRRAVRRLDQIIYRLIRSRRASGASGSDVISMLLGAGGMSDREVRDELMTLFLAGHETTALALTWALHLLGERPEADAALAAELAAVLDGHPTTIADMPRLPYTEAVILESLRLYPPAYAISREAVRATTIAGRAVSRGSVAFISVWAVHHDPVRFDDPWSFRPERWLDGLGQRLPRGAYLPFGEGPRKCVGASFAMQEAVLVLATIARRFRLSSASDQAIPLRPAVTLRPAGEIPMTIQDRRAVTAAGRDRP
jgi:cytochrome P450